jgi:ribosomal protein S18 acetylase RimI-like enzyme
LSALAALAQDHGFARLSLSVEPENPARRLYERVGYREVGGDGNGGLLMLVRLQD